MMWIIISYSRMQKYFMHMMYSIVQKLSNKHSTKVFSRFDRLKTVHSKRQKEIRAMEK